MFTGYLWVTLGKIYEIFIKFSIIPKDFIFIEAKTLGTSASTKPVLRINLILMRIRIRIRILDPNLKKIDQDPDPGHFFKIY